MHAEHDGEQGLPVAAEEVVLVTVVPVALHAVVVE